MKKIIAIISSATIPILAIFLVILVAVLVVLDFFGTNSTDGYVVDNMAYADDYKKVLNENIDNGYVSLERILYFYLARDGQTFSKIYSDNLDTDLKRMKPISEVCAKDEYKYFSGCNAVELKMSNQIDEYQNKPFGKPMDFSKATITSFFMEQRIVFDSFDVHSAWDFAAPEQTELTSVCDGTVLNVSFPYSENIADTSGGSGNYIVLKCNVDGTVYKVTYAHLYPGSSKVSTGDPVTKGQAIASVGTTGYSTGNHLHYQVQREDNTYVDGMSLIDFSDGTVTVPSTPPSYYPQPELRPNLGY